MRQNDIHARIRAEDIVDTIREALLVLDERLRVVSANRSFYETFRVSPDETVGRPIYALGGGQWNIPELRRLLEQLRSRSEELAAANRELEAFSYSVAHDLRNPLLILKGFTNILIENYAGRLEAEGRDYLARIVGSAERMNAIIDDILALSRISRQETTLADLDLSDMARQTMQELRKGQPERAVDVSIQTGLTVRADARLISVALGNLPGNAWKYTGKAERPRIEFGALRQGEQTVYFVKDNGAGFDMARAERLFRPFQRLHSDKEFAGTGVGLAIVERAISRHGGRVWAQSEPGKGSTFFFTLEKAIPIREDDVCDVKPTPPRFAPLSRVQDTLPGAGYCHRAR
jgi:light-regulated signal transduction histidine kinase (bacteriophytochrome)